jgi:hypothetical protein
MILILGSVVLPPAVRASLVNLGEGGKVASQSTTLTTFTADRAVNGSTVGGQPDITHTTVADSAPFWRFDFGGTARLDSMELFNRTDCCGGRLRDITVEVLDYNDQVVYTSPLLNPDNSLGGGEADYAVGPSSPLTLSLGGVLGRHVRISRTVEGTANGDQSVLSLSEVRVWSDNVALGAAASQTSTYGGNSFPASLGVDGNLGNFTHTLNSDPAPSLTVDLGQGYFIDSVLLHNRDGCCQGRLRDIRVEFLAADGNTVVYASPELNDGGVLGGPPFLGVDLHQLTGSPVAARFVRVSRLDTVTGSDDASVLALGEVQVFGTVVPEPHTALLLGLGALALRRRRART